MDLIDLVVMWTFCGMANIATLIAIDFALGKLNKRSSLYTKNLWQLTLLIFGVLGLIGTIGIIIIFIVVLFTWEIET